MAGKVKGQSEEEYQKMILDSHKRSAKKHKKRLETDPAYNQKFLKDQHNELLRKDKEKPFVEGRDGLNTSTGQTLENYRIWQSIRADRKKALKKIAKKK